VLFAATILMSIYFLAFTATGLTWILKSNINDSSARISIAGMSYSLNGSTTLRDLNYKSDFADIDIKKVVLFWNPLSIFSNQVVIEKLSGEQLTVNLKTTSAESDSVTHLEFPFATNVVTASISDLSIKTDGKTIYSIASTSIDNIFLEESFYADKILLKVSEGIWTKLSGQFGFSNNSVINLTTESSFVLPAKNTAVHARGTLVGNAAQLRFMQEISSPVSASISGRIKHLFTNPTWVLDTKLNSIDLSEFLPGQFMKNLSGDISAQGGLKKFEVKSTLLLKDYTDKLWSANLEAVSNIDNIDFTIKVNSQDQVEVTHASHASFNGSFKLTNLISQKDIIHGLKISGNWNDFFVPLNENHTVIARSGDLTFDGANLASKITARGVKLNTLGPTLTKLVLNTQRDDKGELFFNGSAATTDGNLKLSGSMVKHNSKYQMDNLFLTGSNFTLVRKPQAHIIVSPNLAFVRKDKVMTSTGTVQIPTANIQLQEFRHTLSTLARLIDSSNRPIGATGYVDVKFGKSVWMHGFGLNANVTGDLSLRDLSNRQIVATGELNVVRGNYHKLNENLTLSGGRLMFNNIGIDNPELDLKIKSRKTTTAQINAYSGENIKGQLQKLFSDANKNKKIRIQPVKTPGVSL